MSRRIQFLFFLLVSLSYLVCSHIWSFFPDYWNTVFLQMSGLCMIQIFSERIKCENYSLISIFAIDNFK